MIPPAIKVKNNELPDNSGVYFYYDAGGTLLYVGKATSLRKRVGSYFFKAHDNRIADLVRNIVFIDYIETPTVIEALVLEANQIKALRPKYNILQRDDKSFLYLAVTNDPYPKPLLMRGLDLERLGVDPFDRTLSPRARKLFLAVFGPYTSGSSLRRALEFIRKAIPWSTCDPPEATPSTSPFVRGRVARPCFNVHIRLCPGVCAGKISREDYRKIIRQLILFFEGKKAQLVRQMKKEMEAASKAQRFEEASRLRNTIFALEHIQDVALVMRDDVELPFSRTPEEGIDLNGRIEAYDISNISGTSAVGSMVVFQEGKPAKDQYRKFKIKTVRGSDDFAMMEEVMRRRLARAKHFPNAWPLPVLMVIDGGEGQVSHVQEVLNEMEIKLPIVGLAKGFDRKQDRLVFDRTDPELVRVATRGKELFQQARDEAHRFAVAYHRKVRAKAFLPKHKKRYHGVNPL
ncbi:excinuclease ABC subunit UvrC [Candidatus Uhrbacteria bacterium]|nr:excinuclease ABC subunit UvrC [Candidatus Uhrbacteria bacterium]